MTAEPESASAAGPGSVTGPAPAAGTKGPTGISDDPRVYFAAERTFLAWIRTGLGLMGVGFAVSRFGLFLREMRASEMGASETRAPVHASVHGTGLSVMAGVALVVLGVVVLVSAVTHHLHLVRQLKSGRWTASVSRNAVVLAVLLAAAGVGMAVYLVYLH